jgi:hypothetical protein
MPRKYRNIILSEMTYNMLKTYKIAQRHKSFDEAIRYLLANSDSDDKRKRDGKLVTESIDDIRKAYMIIYSFNELTERMFNNLVVAEKMLKDLLLKAGVSVE